MTLEEVARRIENPNLISVQDISALEKLIERYPYAQSFPLLLLTALGRSGDLRFDDQLNKYAFRIADRMRLHELVHSDDSELLMEGVEEETEVEVEEEVEEEVEVEETEDEVQTEMEEKVEEEVEVEEETDMGVETEMEDEVEVEVEEETDMEVEEEVETEVEDEVEVEVEEETDMEVEVETEMEEEVEEETEVEETEDEVETEMEEEVEEETEMEVKAETEDKDEVEVDVDEKVEAEIENRVFEPPINQIIPPITVDLVEIKEQTSNESDIDEKKNKNKKRRKKKKESSYLDQLEVEHGVSGEANSSDIEVESIFEAPDYLMLNPQETIWEREVEVENDSDIETETDRFTSEVLAQSDHLTIQKNEEKENDLLAQEIKEVPSSEGPEVRSFTEWLRAKEFSTKIPQGKKELLITHKTEIIDRFIEEEPKITRFKNEPLQAERKKTPFFNPIEKAKKSIEEKEIPISETLAKIFVAQGHFPKAIEVYTELILLIPEKKIFFADQIEKLEQKSNR